MKGNSDEVVIETHEQSKTKETSGLKAYLSLWSYAEPIDVVLRLIAVVAAIAAGTALPLMTLVFGNLVNDFNTFGTGETSPSAFRESVNDNTIWFVYLFIGKFITIYIHTSLFTITATRATRKIRLQYIQDTMRQDISYFDTCSPGSVATKTSSNANLVQGGLAEKVGTVIQGVTMLIAAFVVAFSRQWKLSLVVSSSLPAVIVAVGITLAMDTRLEAKILDIYTKSGSLVEEAFSSIRILTAFNARDKILKKNDFYLDEAKKYGFKKGPVLGVMYSSEFSIMYAAYALAFWYGVRLLFRGEIDNGGTVVTVLLSVLIGTSALTNISPAFADFAKAGGAARDFLEMKMRKPLININESDKTLGDSLSGELDVKGVNFFYPARPTIQVLDNISLNIPANKVTALVGASGCGKSTIISLLERFYDPADGQISLDGHDVRSLNLKWLRSKMRLVQQEPVLFDDTIYVNVAFGLAGTEMDNFDEQKKRELVRQACVQSYADEFIQRLPQGYDTRVGERGGSLSGGQKQRIAIARSVISDPRILLLDEATSALDPKAEGIVQAALDAVSRSRTTVMIAHRLSTVKKADKIIVFSKGRVIEEGTHSSLLAADGAYANLVRVQNLGAGEGDPFKPESANTDVSGDDDDSPPVDLEKVATRRSSFHDEERQEEKDVARKLSLAKCLTLIFKQHANIWPLGLLSFIGSFIGGAVFPLQAFFFSRLVTVFQYEGERLQSRTNFWALMFFVLSLTTLFAYASIGFTCTISAFIVTRYYRRDYFSNMLSQDISFFDAPGHSSGSLTAQLATDTQSVLDLVSVNLGLIVIVLVNIVSNCVLALAVGWRLALVAIFGGLPIIFIGGFLRMRLEIQSQDRNAKLYAESARFASEAVGAIRTVMSLTLESKVYDNYANRLRGPVQRSYKHTAVSMIFFGLAESADLLAMALTFWYGGQRLSVGEYSVTQFFLIFVAIVFGGQAAGMLFGFTLNTTKAHAAANRILDLQRQTPKINGSKGISLACEDEKVAVEFNDVKFHYDTRPDIRVLRGLNFSILAGQKIGFVGPSGCGKTTVISLLERFYDAKAGEIYVHGQSLSQIDVRAHRSRLGLVSQETSLYQGTVRDNILLGIEDEADAGIGDDALHKACRDANILDFILSLPQGFDTDCGSRGQAFSGGQRQRLAIARALVRDPKILLLDEATSALDTESEKVVQEALEVAAEGRTTIAVAHRLSTVRNADQIFVLEAGRVVERGTHMELIALRGRYCEMCKAQSLDMEVAA